MIIVFSITGNKILDSLETSPLLASLVSTAGDHLCYLIGIMGILFSIGLFLGFYNLTCIKDLGVTTYSGNVGDFITVPIGFIIIILALVGFILKQLYNSPYLLKIYFKNAKNDEEKRKKMINLKKNYDVFWSIYIFVFIY